MNKEAELSIKKLSGLSNYTMKQDVSVEQFELLNIGARP